MKETYVLGMFPNGMARPCIIRRETSPFLKIGEKIMTNVGTAVCITEEVGRWSDEEDPVGVIANAMDFNRLALPVVIGQIEERMWNDDEKK